MCNPFRTKPRSLPGISARTGTEIIFCEVETYLGSRGPSADPCSELLLA